MPENKPRGKRSNEERSDDEEDCDRKPSALKRPRKTTDDEQKTDKGDETLRTGESNVEKCEEQTAGSGQNQSPTFQSAVAMGGRGGFFGVSAPAVRGDQWIPTGAESLASRFQSAMNTQLRQLLDPSSQQTPIHGGSPQVTHLQALARMLSSHSTQQGQPTNHPRPLQTRADRGSQSMSTASDSAYLQQPREGLAGQLPALQAGLYQAQLAQLYAVGVPSIPQVPHNSLDSSTLQALSTLLASQQQRQQRPPQDPASTMLNAMLLSQQIFPQPQNVSGVWQPPAPNQLMELFRENSMNQAAPTAGAAGETIEADGSGNSSNTDLGLEFTGRPPILMYIPDSDEKSLSEFQCLVRKQIELFEADEEMVERHAQGRNKPIFLGQVGIRCRHCTSLPPPHRARGAVFFPSKARGIYQAAQNMANSHLMDHCQHIPNDLKEEISRLHRRKSSAGGGKKYWEDGLTVHGVFEDSEGLRFERR